MVDLSSLKGQLLIAMPQMADSRFAKAVIYVCVHNEEGVMGLVLNRLVDSLTFQELAEQLNLSVDQQGFAPPVHYGGPVESGRGFVLHTDDYCQDGTLIVDDGIGMTATIDVLEEIAVGNGPEKFLIALGYAGWGPGQLESEIANNDWLHVAADHNLVFDSDFATKWEDAIGKMGININMLSAEAGHA